MQKLRIYHDVLECIVLNDKLKQKTLYQLQCYMGRVKIDAVDKILNSRHHCIIAGIGAVKESLNA